MAFRVERTDSGTRISIKPDLERTRRIAKQRGYSDIQAEILAELTALNPIWIYTYNIKAVLNIADGYGVRLHHRSSRVVNIDIIYDPCSDTYRVEAYRVNGLDVEKIASYDYVYFPELEERISEVLR